MRRCAYSKLKLQFPVGISYYTTCCFLLTKCKNAFHQVLLSRHVKNFTPEIFYMKFMVKMNFMKLSIAFLFLLIANFGCSQNTSNKHIAAHAGGSCEGCEAIYESPVPF